MIQNGKKNISDVKEKLHKMRMEIQELEETIDMCETNNRYNDYDDYEYRNRNYRERTNDREYRGRY